MYTVHAVLACACVVCVCVCVCVWCVCVCVLHTGACTEPTLKMLRTCALQLYSIYMKAYIAKLCTYMYKIPQKTMLTNYIKWHVDEGTD